jgi:hypothetical protein
MPCCQALKQRINRYPYLNNTNCRMICRHPESTEPTIIEGESSSPIHVRMRSRASDYQRGPQRKLNSP